MGGSAPPHPLAPPLQFLVIWRLMRAAALCDGVDPPENMGRCVCNNYDVAVRAGWGVGMYGEGVRVLADMSLWYV